MFMLCEMIQQGALPVLAAMPFHLPDLRQNGTNCTGAQSWDLKPHFAMSVLLWQHDNP